VAGVREWFRLGRVGWGSAVDGGRTAWQRGSWAKDEVVAVVVERRRPVGKKKGIFHESLWA